MRKTNYLLALTFSVSLLSAQETDFAKVLNDPNATFQEAKNAFDNYWKEKDHTQKGKGYTVFKRMEYMARFRENSNGLIGSGLSFQEYLDIYNATAQNKSGNQHSPATVNSWSYVGPNTNFTTTGGGAGRLSALRFHPTNPNTLYVGGSAGGLWVSNNSGTTWTPLTDQLASLMVSDVAIDPSNPNILYIASGERDASFPKTNGIGVIKSTDGGLTWYQTSLFSITSTNLSVNRILINPNNPQHLIAATNQGIYRSNDAGSSWYRTATGNFKDLVANPLNFNTIYATGTSIVKSINGGHSFNVSVGAGLPGGVSRYAIAVTANDTNYVYVVAGQPASSNYGLLGVYRSVNGGSNFTQMTGTSPNLLGWNNTGTDSGGQAWYDLVIAVSPTDKNFVLVGGVNTWKSTNGGTSWTLNTYQSTGAGVPRIHADCHVIEFQPGSGTTYYLGTDGGIAKTTNGGTSFTDLGGTLYTAQIYRLGVSQTNPALTLTGWQDNGTSLHNGTSSTWVNGGDGMECIISYANASNMFAESQYGSIRRSTNGGASFSSIVNTSGTGLNSEGDWITPYVLDPVNATTIYVGKDRLYKSTNNGTSFTPLAGITSGQNITWITVAPSNTNYIYVLRGNTFLMSNDGGNTFNSYAIPQGSPSAVAVDNNNPQRIWLSCGGYNAGAKVYYSANNGVSWTNVSAGLPNVPANHVVYHNGSNDGVYVATDMGVYYKDATMPAFVRYSNGLPNVMTFELEIQYSSGKLRAATIGRGLWEVDLYAAPTAPPVAAFTSTRHTICPNQQIDFFDNSSELPYSWTWYLPGATPSISNAQSPTVTYSNPGVYPVSLVVTNALGTDSIYDSTYVTVYNLPNVFAGNDTTVCKGDTAFLHGSGGNYYLWAPATQLSATNVQNPYYVTTFTRTYTLTVTDGNGCTATDAVKINVVQPLATPVISANGNQLTASTTANYYWWYLNGNLLPNDTIQTITYSQAGNYTVIAMDTNGCKSAVSTPFTAVSVPNYQLAESIKLIPNPNNGIFQVQFPTGMTGNYSVSIFDVLGKKVFQSDKREVELNRNFFVNISLPDGSYLLEINADGVNLGIKKRLLVINQ